MSLELPALGQTGSAVARTSVKLSAALVMQSFAFSLDSEVGRFEARGELVGDTTLVGDDRLGRSVQTLSYRLAEPPVFSAIVPDPRRDGRRLRGGQDACGSRCSTRPRCRRARSRCACSSTTRWSCRTRWRWTRPPVASPPSAGTDSGVEDRGGVRRRLGGELGGRRRPRDPRLQPARLLDGEDGIRAGQPGRATTTAGCAARSADEDVIFSTAIRSNVDLGAVERHAELRFRLTGARSVRLRPGRRKADAPRRHADRAARGLGRDRSHVRLPYPSMDLREELQPEPLIQSDDPRIIEAAERFTGRRAVPEPEPAPGGGGAHRGGERAARARRSRSRCRARCRCSSPGAGDCNEHTVLFVALARALGLPARTAVGLVYLDGSFYYHAWPEVWLGEWVAVDPDLRAVRPPTRRTSASWWAGSRSRSRSCG